MCSLSLDVRIILRAERTPGGFCRRSTETWGKYFFRLRATVPEDACRIPENTSLSKYLDGCAV